MPASSESGGSSSPHRQWGVWPALGKLSKSLYWSDPTQLSERADAGWENELYLLGQRMINKKLWVE